jgi:hypothetical protein
LEVSPSDAESHGRQTPTNQTFNHHRFDREGLGYNSLDIAEDPLSNSDLIDTFQRAQWKFYRESLVDPLHKNTARYRNPFTKRYCTAHFDYYKEV